MKKELQEYYEHRFTMMATRGWQDLMEDVDLMLQSTDTLAGVDTEQLLHFRKGELSILHWLKNLRDASSEVYDQLQQEEKDAETLI
jgi:hypothetical protein